MYYVSLTCSVSQLFYGNFVCCFFEKTLKCQALDKEQIGKKWLRLTVYKFKRNLLQL